MGEKNDRIKELEKQIEDLMHRWPAHSVKPAMVQRLDELEEELRKAQIERERREKDVFFAGHWQSPIPPKDRAGFGGLDYYPPDPDCRFEIELYEHEEKKMVRMAYTKGEECVLQAYKSDAEEEQLFISFRDATSGQETYGAGRYLDLDAARNRTADGKWILDFNRAYNPWCVYSEDYTCPFVPQENWLAVPEGWHEAYARGDADTHCYEDYVSVEGVT